jgi:lambda family phage tail tape measure protein
MTEESIGTARLDVVVETSGMTSGVNAVKNEIKGLNTEAQKQFDGMTKAQQRMALSFVSTAQNAGKTREEIRALQAEMRIGGALGKQLADNLRAAGKTGNFKSATAELDRYGMSAKQTAAALRGVPAQLTDIVTSLSTGQRPLSVLLQQGGQLKDMFGGIVPAARALGGAVLGLVNPFTVSAAAVLGWAVAWKQGADEAANFRKALDLTGNTVGLTAQRLQSMSADLAAASNTTQHDAASALAQVAASGKFTADQLGAVAQAAIDMQKATGQAIDDTIAQFAKLTEAPAEAAAEANKQYHFLTAAVYEQIRALQAQGREQEAATLLINEFGRASSERSRKAVEDADAITRAWHSVKEGISGVIDELRNFGRLNTPSGVAQFNIAGAVKQLHGLEQMMRDESAKGAGASMGAVRAANARIVELKTLIADSQRVLANDPELRAAAKRAADQRANDLAVQLSQEADTYKTGLEKLTSEKIKAQRHMAEAVAAAQKAGDKEALQLAQESGKRLIDGIDKKIEEEKKKHKGPKPPNLEPATNRQNLQAFEDELKKEQGLIANQTQVLEASYAARNISAEAYYAKQKELAKDATDAQTKALEGEIAVLQSRSVKGRLSIENATELAQKEAELAKVRADGATKIQVLNIQEQALLKQRQAANQAYQDALDQQKSAIQDEIDSQVLRISSGDKEFAQRSKLIQIYRDEAKELLNLARQRDDGDIDADTYEKRVEQIKQFAAEAVKAWKDGFAAIDTAQMNWVNGATRAFANYRDAANDVAGQAEGIFTDAMHGLEDVFVDFFTKGKADWKGFFDGIAAEITRFVVRQQLSKLAQKFLPGLTGGEGDSSASALSGAAGQLAASATPLYGAAAALSASASALAAAGGAQSISGGTTTNGGGGWIDALFSLFSSGGGEQWYANGGAFENGVQKFAYGGVVSSPTNFGMSGGRLGLMGESGPEAILPLHRGPDGKLGVRMEAANEPQRTGPTVVNQSVYVQGRIDSRTPTQFAQATAREQNRASSRNR